MKKLDLIIDKEYVTYDGIKAFFRGFDEYGDSIFEISLGQKEGNGVELWVGKPEPIATDLYWCHAGIEDDFEEITDKNE